MWKLKPRPSQPRSVRKTSSKLERSRQSGTARTRITIGLTLRNTARRISRLKDVCVFIPPSYEQMAHQSQTPGLLLLSNRTATPPLPGDPRVHLQTVLNAVSG